MTTSFQCFVEGLRINDLDELYSLFKNDFFEHDMVEKLFNKYDFTEFVSRPNTTSFFEKVDDVMDVLFSTKTTVDYIVFLCNQIINDNSPLNDIDLYSDIVTTLKNMSDHEVRKLAKRSVNESPLSCGTLSDIPDERVAVREFISWDNEDDLDFVKIEKLKDEILDWGGIPIVYHPSEPYQEKRCKNILDNIRRHPSRSLKRIVHDELVDMHHENQVYMDIDDLEIYDGEENIFLIDKNEVIDHLSSIDAEMRELYIYKSSLTTTIVFSEKMLNFYKLTDFEFYDIIINGIDVHYLVSMMKHIYDSSIMKIGSASTCMVNGVEYRLHRFVNKTYNFKKVDGHESGILQHIEDQAIIINI